MVDACVPAVTEINLVGFTPAATFPDSAESEIHRVFSQELNPAEISTDSDEIPNPDAAMLIRTLPVVA
jgi:hypothetical protein